VEPGHSVPIYGNDPVLLVEEFHVLDLPVAAAGEVVGGDGRGGLLAEEDEAAVAFDVEGGLGGRLRVRLGLVGVNVGREPLRDRSLHLADGAVGDGVQVDQGAVLAVRDELAFGASLFRDLDEVVDGEAAAPCCGLSGQPISG